MTQGLIIVGDVLDGLARLDDNSVDAVVTDPPYELAFMGSKWDATGVAFRQETWEACLRVLKPGGHLIAFGGGRTHHRMWCAIEDAGFEVRELVCWLFGTGFPKSLDVSKAIDKRRDWTLIERLAQEIKRSRIVVGWSLAETGNRMGVATSGQYGRWYHRGGHMFFETGRSLPSRPEWHHLRNLLPIEAKFQATYDAAEREVVGWRIRTGKPPQPMWGEQEGQAWNLTAPATDAAKQWEGYGTALKPAVEPILLARKPLSEPTVAANVLKWGTGALAIDATRIAGVKPQVTQGVNTSGTSYNVARKRQLSGDPNVGRWPPNVIFECTCDDPQPLPEKARKRKNEPTQSKLLGDAEPAPATPETPQGTVHQPDCPAGMLDAQAGERKSGKMKAGQQRKQTKGGGGYHGNFPDEATATDTYGDTGGPSRFFYCSKASRAERERGLEDFEPVTGAEAVNRKPDTAGLKSPRAGAGRSAKEVKCVHPTVKPIALMRWLVRLVTPLGGLVLDPFCGSGSTLIAAREEGHDFVGVDLSAEYCRIAQARAGGAELVAAEAPEDTEPEWEE